MTTTALPATSAQLSSIVTWREMLRLKPVWNHLAATNGESVLLGHDWFVQSWKAFPENRRPEILVYRRDGEVRGLLPLRRKSHPGFRHLGYLDDWHSHRLDLIAAHGEIEPMLWALGDRLRRRRDWDVLDLVCLRAATAERAMRIWREAGLEVRVRGVLRQRYVPLNGSWPEVAAVFRRGLISDLRRREKRLRECGPVEVRCHTGWDGLGPLLDRCFAVEASGWKGREGTAIRCNASVERFYRQLAFRMARQKRLRIYSLWLGGEMLAFQYSLTNGRTAVSLKVGYCESYHSCSPGKILRWHVLRMACEEGCTRFDFLGQDQPHQAEWTPFAESLMQLRVYNSTLRGRALAYRSSLWRWWRSRGKPEPMIDATTQPEHS